MMAATLSNCRAIPTRQSAVYSYIRWSTTTTTTTTPPYNPFEEPPHWNKFPDGSRFWKENGYGRKQRPIFVAATRQHVGKTTTSLALMSGLSKRYNKVGFLKPVGQQHVTVKSDSLNTEIRVDKDVCLVREYFKLYHIDYEHMSPVIIPQGCKWRIGSGSLFWQRAHSSLILFYLGAIATGP
jgi:hypothetical protein